MIVDRVKVKTEIMMDALNGRIEYPAKLLSYIDGIAAIYENPNAEIYTTSKDIAIAAKYIGHKDIIVSRMNFIKIANNLPTRAMFFLAEEKTEELSDLLGIADLVAREKLKNAYPVLFESSISPSEYSITWNLRDFSTPKALVPYYRVNMIIGQAWGELEGKEEALTTKVDKKLYEVFMNNVKEVEIKRKEQIEEYLLKQNDGNKK